MDTDPTAADSGRHFEKYARRNRVFILGAGFSAFAGVPLTNRLLASAMQSFCAEAGGLYERVNAYVEEALGASDGAVEYATANLSDICTYLEFIELREHAGGERWSDEGCREKLALRFFLSKALALSTPAPKAIPALYLRFAKQLHHRDIVITFNWDLLLENALDAIGVPYSYGFDDHKVKVLKLHGSINWNLGRPHDLGRPANTLEWNPIDWSQAGWSPTIWCSRLLSHQHEWLKWGPLREVKPYLVLPGYGKAFDVRALATLWYKPEFAFATTHDVYIIGLSLAPDDHFVRDAFRFSLPYLEPMPSAGGRRIFVFNPDPKTHDNYRFIARTGFTDIITEPFSEAHLDLIEERLREADAL